MPLPISPGITPGSDGAGKIIAIGSSVARLCPSLLGPSDSSSSRASSSSSSSSLGVGQKVVTHLAPHAASDSSLPGFDDIGAGLGQKEHGTLTRRGVFHYSALLPVPDRLGYEATASLTCSGLTAWNALMGCEGRKVKRGDWVLVQGTGGVSVAALQVSQERERERESLSTCLLVFVMSCGVFDIFSVFRSPF